MIKGKINFHKLKALISTIHVFEPCLFQVEVRVKELKKILKQQKKIISKLAKLDCEK